MQTTFFNQPFEYGLLVATEPPFEPIISPKPLIYDSEPVRLPTGSSFSQKLDEAMLHLR
jgi:hypothetical protein